MPCGRCCSIFTIGSGTGMVDLTFMSTVSKPRRRPPHLEQLLLLGKQVHPSTDGSNLAAWAAPRRGLGASLPDAWNARCRAAPGQRASTHAPLTPSFHSV